MNRDIIASLIDTTFQGFNEAKFIHGKVRDIIDLGTKMIICTTDRISAFDRILTTIPCKGEVLNGMSMYWFGQTDDIVPNHIEKQISARTVVVKKYEVLPVEVVVRAYLTGSAWRDYRKNRRVSGIQLPEGMRFNEKFPEPLLTPSTKAEKGFHDVPISSEDVVAKELVNPGVWEIVQNAALNLFRRGAELAASRGLILVDTKYEFGLDNEGRVVLVDEIHTPDSSRYWFADTYRELFEAEQKQQKIDKEYLRQWLMDQGFMGDGGPPVIPDEMRINVAEKYIEAFELITGSEFHPESRAPAAEAAVIDTYLKGISTVL